MEELDEDDVEEQEDRGDEDRFEYADDELIEVISGFLSGSNCIDWALCLVEISILWWLWLRTHRSVHG